MQSSSYPAVGINVYQPYINTGTTAAASRRGVDIIELSEWIGSGVGTPTPSDNTWIALF
jgi:hypothetical protein